VCPGLAHHVPRGVGGANQRQQRKQAHVPAEDRCKEGANGIL
jgi:hypothetical protein